MWQILTEVKRANVWIPKIASKREATEIVSLKCMYLKKKMDFRQIK